MTASFMTGAVDLHSPRLHREGGADWLSLALIDARNRTLAWLAAFEGHEHLPAPAAPVSPARWLAGHAAWFQERWIARNPRRSQGLRGSAAKLDDMVEDAPLASIEPRADGWWDDRAQSVADRWQAPLADGDVTRAYMVETLEVTLDLLAQLEGRGRSPGQGSVNDPNDRTLDVYRAALFHEDRLVERFAALAQAQGVASVVHLLAAPTLLAPRDPIEFPSQRVGDDLEASAGWRSWEERIGAGCDGAETLPAFEIDAQPVSWQQFAEFIEDGGYDDARWWSAAGWSWLQASGRRGPRDVEQWRHGVLLQRFGKLVRANNAAPAVGLCKDEAEAWCRWAGRRLPAAPEWELAASIGRSRGFAWGQASEWVLGRAADGSGRSVQRGLAWFEPRRLARPGLRRFIESQRDDGFCGFRSCAL